MAAPWRVGCLLARSTSICFTKSTYPVSSVQPVIQNCTIQSFCQQQTRHSSIFTKLTGDDLWRGVIAVSNAGKKRGRGKRVGRKKTTNLNIGQSIGDGRANILWPGLNAPVMKNKEVMQRKQLPVDSQRQDRLAQLRDSMGRITYPSTPPLIRGFTGGRMVGYHYGKPDPIGDYKFEGFDSVLLELKLVTNMTGNLGRKQRFTAFMIVGNGNGLAGLGLGRGTRVSTAVRVAKNRAAQSLVYVPRFQDHTVYHNMFSQYHSSKVFIHKKEEGYGVRAHRVINSICKIIGLKDLHCKVEGSTKNTKCVTRAFFAALTNQETHQDLADRLGYHVVQLRKERDYLPETLASPSSGAVKKEVYKADDEDIEMTYDRLYYDGKVEYQAVRKNPLAKTYGWRKKVETVHKRRNQLDAQVLRLAGLA